MFSRTRNVEPKYSPVVDEPEEDRSLMEEDLEEQGLSPVSTGRTCRLSIVVGVVLVFCLATACLYAHKILARSVNAPGIEKSHYPHPPTRREWRTLPMAQKHNYLQAVQCLKTTESRLGLNQSLYDDFPWVHSRYGEYVHDAAPFLAWHRYFVHLYETALKEDCGYEGHMPYWNWELDWENVTASPVWDPSHGFGSNGVPEQSDRAVLNGYCVVDGPFRDFDIPYLDEMYRPHCLSRGFLGGEELQTQAKALRPDKIEQLLELDDYESFNLGVENGPHLAIPRSIRGDFSLLTAPSDPVFFLHHAQLDRLWWRWQTENADRQDRYEGIAAHGTTSRARITDRLEMGGFAPDVKVSAVLSTTSNLLCYRY